METLGSTSISMFLVHVLLPRPHFSHPTPLLPVNSHFPPHPTPAFTESPPSSPFRSNHFAVIFCLSYVPVTSSSSAKSLFDYSKADWTGLLEYLLNYNFDLLFHDNDIDIFGSLSRTFSCPPFICMFL